MAGVVSISTSKRTDRSSYPRKKEMKNLNIYGWGLLACIVLCFTSFQVSSYHHFLAGLHSSSSAREMSYGASTTFGMLPEGAPPKPSGFIVVNEEEVNSERSKLKYGGEGDAKHLGGFTEL